jgi:nitrite reductase/ring-hydroxylating ferredoxin subunit
MRTHPGALLSEDNVVDGLIECPLHFGLFITGKAQGPPVTRDSPKHKPRGPSVICYHCYLAYIAPLKQEEGDDFGR